MACADNVQQGYGFDSRLQASLPSLLVLLQVELIGLNSKPVAGVDAGLSLYLSPVVSQQLVCLHTQADKQPAANRDTDMKAGRAAAEKMKYAQKSFWLFGVLRFKCKMLNETI